VADNQGVDLSMTTSAYLTGEPITLRGLCDESEEHDFDVHLSILAVLPECVLEVPVCVA
jgi:hypothetical protein